jgi:hypothetical protein
LFDASGDGSPRWLVRWDDGATNVVTPDQIVPASAVDRLAELV